MNKQEYHLAVSVTSGVIETPANRDMILKQLQEAGARRLWIALDHETLYQTGEERAAFVCELREQVDFYKAAGVETGLWIRAFGFGGPLSAVAEKVAGNWTSIRGVTQKEEVHADAFCPEDPGFSECYSRYVGDMAGVGADLLMLDDDLCLSVRPGLGCFCDRHMELLSKELGRSCTREDFEKYAFVGESNAYRKAWKKVMGETLKDFCAKVRAAADRVNPNLRLGFCSGYTSWDVEGADAIELTHILAGDNKPFLRFTSAPYWVTKERRRFPGMKLNTVIETMRAQESWCRSLGIEVFSENDTYPRPRYHTPASYMECFDVACRVNGGMGTLKYMFDYTSSPEYETGYLKIHKRNKPLYEWIEKEFAGMSAKGVKVYYPMHTIESASLPKLLGPKALGGEKDIMQRFFSDEAALLTQHSIPVIYEDFKSEESDAFTKSEEQRSVAKSADCGIAFGEHAKYIDTDRMPKKLILDLPGALNLQKKGICVGLTEAEKSPAFGKEEFVREDGSTECVGLYYSGIGRAPCLGGGFYKCKIDEKAQVQSYFLQEGQKVPASYIYRNDNTEFLILLIDTYVCGQSSSVLSSYERQRQLLEFAEKKYPYIEKETGIYTIYKENETGSKCGVFFENISEDGLFDFSVKLGRKVNECKAFGAEGELSADRTEYIVRTEVPPMGMFLLVFE